SFARRMWPADDPLGKKFGDEVVVGISANARFAKLEDPDMAQAYYLAQPADLPSMTVLVKTLGSPEAFARSAASIAKTVDPKIFPEVQLLKSSLRQKLQGAEYAAAASSLLGFVALLIACLGIFGLVAFAVSRRTKEIGLRMALGARPSHILAAVLRQFSLPVAAGLLVGVGVAAALSQLLRRELYGISNFDPITYLAAVGIFTIVVALAALLPARRALRVDPMLALRED
ncbi:MAG: FtsX-like permease family protein, partial [Bryobacteraceae bacterium]